MTKGQNKHGGSTKSKNLMLTWTNCACAHYVFPCDTSEKRLNNKIFGTGLFEPEHLEYKDVTRVSASSSEDTIASLQTRLFVKQAREVRMASLDYKKVNFPIGVVYCGNKGLHRNIIRVAQRCSGCLKTDTECMFHYDNCFGGKIICDVYSTSGYIEWHRRFRPCGQRKHSMH